MISIAASTSKIEVDNRFPLFKYYRAADNLFKQANIYREEKNIVELYILLLRFCSLVSETIPNHRDYRTASAKLRNEYIKRLKQVLLELEKLKPEVQKELKRSTASDAPGYKTNGKNQYEWPLSNFQGSTQLVRQCNQANAVLQSFPGKPYQLEDHLSNLSFTLPPANLETLSRHSFLGQSDLRAPVDFHHSQAKVHYPTYDNVSSLEIPRVTEISTDAIPTFEDSCLRVPWDSKTFESHQDSRRSDYSSQLRLLNEPFAPPVAAFVKNVPSTSSGFVNPIPPSRVADPFPGPVPSAKSKLDQSGEKPKQLYISAKMMDEFLRLAMKNTKINLETCGVLAGCLKNTTFYVTALIIPKQEATSDSCRSFTLPPANLETLSRHSFLGQSELRAPVDFHHSQAKVHYPTYDNVSSLEIPRVTEISTDAIPIIEDSCLRVPWDTKTREIHQDSRKSDYASQLRLLNEPFPPPVAAFVKNIPSTSSGFVNPIPPSRVADPFPGPVSTTKSKLDQSGEKPKQLYISAKMMDEFLRLAMKNTKINLETCGVLAGCLKNTTFYVTALIIPKQEATSDSCQTVNEEEIFEWQDERNFFQLGWIHTHPKQSCFMSSIDLHTHYSYQVMLPEAIAIVMAPTDTTRTSGIFRLSDPGGVKAIQNCQMRGFHPHEQLSDGSSIYEHCGHVLLSSRLAYQVVDLR